MTTDRRLAGAMLGLALFVAACGSSAASPTASPAASAVASQAPTESPAPASEVAASAAPSDTTGPSMPELSLTPGAAGDLEAMLPSSIGSVTFQKTSIDGSQIAGAGTPIDSSKLDPVLSKYGKSIADVRLAIATGAGGTSPIPEMVYAIQLRGVPATQWANEIGGGSSGGTSMTISGKTVVGSSTGGYTSGYYTKDDILFLVIASDKDASAIFAALP